ncbi:hypothetical protein FWC31_03055 [Candidatus Saccharibacteria bacterium]|nr:hypothetical protein [Candidatus Saccharibacteria bacterium]
MKKILIGIFAITIGVFELIIAIPAPTAAALTLSNPECEDRAKSASNIFLNFPTWYRGLTLEASGDTCVLANDAFEGEEIGPIIFMIALNVVDIVLRFAGLIAVGFVIWGGFHYMLARGEPEHAKKSLNIIRTALIGTVISMISAVAVSFLVWRLSQI